MVHEEKVSRLLSLQEFPGQYSDEQLQLMLANDPELTELLDDLALIKQAFVGLELSEEAIPVEEEWEKFMESEKARLDSEPFTAASVGRNIMTAHPLRALQGEGARVGSAIYKVAASFMGAILVSGIAFAAIHIARSAGGHHQSPTQEVQIPRSHHPAMVPTDTLTTVNAAAQPVVFDNAPLEKMLSQMATYYYKEVEFANGDARQLRFYFVWKPEEGLEATLHRLNLFESVNIELKDNQIIVE